MSTPTQQQTLDDIRSYGDLLGIPPARVQTVIDKCQGDPLELRRRRRKWSEEVRRNHERFNRDLKRAELDEMAAQSRAVHDARMEEEVRYRRAQRRQLTYGARLDAVLIQLRQLSTASSSWTTGSTARGAERTAGPPAAPEVEVGQHTSVIEAHLELLEDTLDAAKGLLPPCDYLKMSTAQKDALLARLGGVHSRTIAEDFPWLGGQRTVEKKRREWGMVPSTGVPKGGNEEEKAA